MLMDNSKGKVQGLGKLAISNDLSISNILLVAPLSFNLLSVGQLCVLELALLGKLIQRRKESNVNKVLTRGGNSSVHPASQGHCTGVFIGA
jgi:hypothetical protein